MLKLIDDTRKFVESFKGKDFVPECERHKLPEVLAIIATLESDLNASAEEQLTFGERWELTSQINGLLKGGWVGSRYKTHRYIESHHLRKDIA